MTSGNAVSRVDARLEALERRFDGFQSRFDRSLAQSVSDWDNAVSGVKTEVSQKLARSDEFWKRNSKALRERIADGEASLLKSLSELQGCMKDVTTALISNLYLPAVGIWRGWCSKCRKRLWMSRIGGRICRNAWRRWSACGRGQWALLRLLSTRLNGRGLARGRTVEAYRGSALGRSSGNLPLSTIVVFQQGLLDSDLRENWRRRCTTTATTYLGRLSHSLTRRFFAETYLDDVSRGHLTVFRVVKKQTPFVEHLLKDFL